MSGEGVLLHAQGVACVEQVTEDGGDVRHVLLLNRCRGLPTGAHNSGRTWTNKAAFYVCAPAPQPGGPSCRSRAWENSRGAVSSHRRHCMGHAVLKPGKRLWKPALSGNPWRVQVHHDAASHPHAVVCSSLLVFLATALVYQRTVIVSLA